MRRGVRRVLVLAAVSAAAGSTEAVAQVGRNPDAAPQPAQQAQRPPAPKAVAERPRADPNDPRMKTLLADWEKTSAQIKTLDVKIVRTDKSPQWGNEEYEGRTLLESPNHAWLDFKKVDVDEQGQRKLTPFERIICTGTEVWQYKPETKQIFVFPLDKQNQQRALEEGPLPFLFNMKAAEAEARYEMSLANEVKDAWIISVVPRLKMDREAFSKAFINLRRESHMPDRIFLISPDGKSTKDFRLSEVKTNKAVAASNFKGVNPGKPWQIVRDPGGDEPEPKAPGLTKRQPPAPPPAANGALPPRRAAAGSRRAPPQ